MPWYLKKLQKINSFEILALATAEAFSQNVLHEAIIGWVRSTDLDQNMKGAEMKVLYSLKYASNHASEDVFLQKKQWEIWP